MLNCLAKENVASLLQSLSDHYFILLKYREQLASRMWHGCCSWIRWSCCQVHGGIQTPFSHRQSVSMSWNWIFPDSTIFHLNMSFPENVNVNKALSNTSPITLC